MELFLGFAARGRHFFTISPKNLQALYTRGKDFGVQPSRLPAMEHFCGRGFLTADGALWNRSRKMLKPTFAKANIADFSIIQRETQSLISKIEEGEAFVLQDLVFVTVRQKHLLSRTWLTYLVLEHVDSPSTRGRCYSSLLFWCTMYSGRVYKSFSDFNFRYWSAIYARPAQVSIKV